MVAAVSCVQSCVALAPEVCLRDEAPRSADPISEQAIQPSPRPGLALVRPSVDGRGGMRSDASLACLRASGTSLTGTSRSQTCASVSEIAPRDYLFDTGDPMADFDIHGFAFLPPNSAGRPSPNIRRFFG